MDGNMELYEIEFEFLKVLFLGFFFGYSFFRLINSSDKSNLREVKHFKYFELNKKRALKIKGPK
jgi:hypothetical protein